MNKLDARKAAKADVIKLAALAKAAEMATEAAKVAKDTHTLVNSNMGLQLRAYATMARRLASLPGATDVDRDVAYAAEKAVVDHEAKQAVVDARK